MVLPAARIDRTTQANGVERGCVLVELQENLSGSEKIAFVPAESSVQRMGLQRRCFRRGYSSTRSPSLRLIFMTVMRFISRLDSPAR